MDPTSITKKSMFVTDFCMLPSFIICVSDISINIYGIQGCITKLTKSVLHSFHKIVIISDFQDLFTPKEGNTWHVPIIY